MTRSFRTVVLVLCLAGGSVQGQQQPAPPTLPVQLTAPEPASTESLVTVDFPGGTVAQYIVALKKASSGTPINIIASDRAAKQPLTTISLKNVPVGVAAYSIRAAATATTIMWDIDQIFDPLQAFHPAIQAFRIDCVPSNRHNEEIVVQALSLQQILRSDNAKASETNSKVALTAIETGLMLRNPDDTSTPELKFHADSGLLFVRGTTAEVQLVTQIVSRMRADADDRQAAAERRAREEQLQTIALKDAQLELRLREMELQAAERSFEEVQRQAAQGQASFNEVNSAELNLGRAKLAIERAKLDQERARLSISGETPPTEPTDAKEGTRATQLEAENALLRKSLLEAQAALKQQSAKPSGRTAK